MPAALAAMKLKAGEVPDHLLERFSRVLAIVVFRNPWDWAISMKKEGERGSGCTRSRLSV